MLSRFHPILERHGQTDRRTDRVAISISRVSVLTRDKHSTHLIFGTRPVLYLYKCHAQKTSLCAPIAGAATWMLDFVTRAVYVTISAYINQLTEPHCLYAPHCRAEFSLGAQKACDFTKTLRYWDRISICPSVLRVRCEQTEDLLQNLLTPPDRPWIWRSCEKKQQKYSQPFFAMEVGAVVYKVVWKKSKFSMNILLYLRNDTWCGYSCNGILIGTYTRPTERCKFEWPWVTLTDSNIFNDTEHRAASLRQLSFLLN